MLAAACSGAPAPRSPAQPVPGNIESRWRVLDEQGETLGYVARTRYAFAEGEVVRFHVENARFQEVGYIDENGRAFRVMPFRDEPEFVLTGSLEDDLQRLLRARSAVKLEALPASFRRSDYP